MYGTIARLNIKPENEAAVKDWLARSELETIEGLTTLYLYKADAGQGEYFMVAVFESKDAYVANANSPEQDRRYRDLLKALEGEPEWHDGEIVYSADIAYSGL